jgi:hypothetical protein
VRWAAQCSRRMGSAARMPPDLIVGLKGVTAVVKSRPARAITDRTQRDKRLSSRGSGRFLEAWRRGLALVAESGAGAGEVCRANSRTVSRLANNVAANAPAMSECC